VIETASSLYRKMMQKGNSRGRAIKSLTASAIYVACRQCNVIRTLDDIAECTDLSKKAIARAYRFMHQTIELNIPLFSFRKYISKYVSQLELCGETELLALKLLSTVISQNLTVGRSPRGITSSCVYIACQIIGEEPTQTDLAEIAQVSEVTIRNRYKEMMKKLVILIKV
jgi:transcription initiation factor TFIIB